MNGCDHSPGLGELTGLRRCDIEQSVLHQAEKMAVALALHAEATGEWGDSGAEFCRGAVARWLCDIPPEAPCYPQQAYCDRLRFYADKHGFSWSPEYVGDRPSDPSVISALSETIQGFVFCVGDREFALQEGEALDRLLRDIGSDLVLVSGYHGTEVNLIVGRGVRVYRAPYTHIALHSEVLRSPSIVMPIVAMIGVHSIVVRELAVKTVFYEKWMPMGDRTWAVSSAERLGVAIKAYALEGYGISLNREAILGIYPDFLADMRVLLADHEVGHGIIQHDLLPEQTALLAESSQLFGSHVLIFLLELLADIAPQRAYGKGPIATLVSWYAEDPARAKRGFGVYLSDAYFYDTMTPHMFGYSHLVLPVMAKLWTLLHTATGSYADVERLLDTVLSWALDWVRVFAAHLADCFDVPVLPEDELDVLKRYLAKGKVLHEAISAQLAAQPNLQAELQAFFADKAPVVQGSLYALLGYTIDPTDPVADIVAVLEPLVRCP